MAHPKLIPLFESLTTPRLLIRPLMLADAPAIYAAVNESREHLRPWLPFADQHQTVFEGRLRQSEPGPQGPRTMLIFARIPGDPPLPEPVP